MKPTGVLTNVYAQRCGLYRRRIEKPHDLNDLHEKTPGKNTFAILNPGASEKHQSSRFETVYFRVALETGVPAAFIAQIIGQISETNRADAATAARAYKTDADDAAPRFICSI